MTFARLSLINSLKRGQPCIAWHGPLACLLLLPDLWFAQRGSLRCPGPRRVTPSGELYLLTVPMGAQGTPHLWPQIERVILQLAVDGSFIRNGCGSLCWHELVFVVLYHPRTTSN